ncbi:MAG: hypothetical protein H0T75_12400 [Rhizobiales bacterium]|nr:hypothetical protein [Hyphomicrobiales bacterium]
MGHIHLHNIPQSKQWRDVVGLITDGAAVAQIAAASAKAAEHGLMKAADDDALAYSFWLLTQMPQAARQEDFGSQLRALGLRVSDKPTLLEITAAFTEAIDRRVREAGRRTDIGEMAQLAAAESVSALVGRELPSLFGPSAEDVQTAFRKLGTSDRFSVLARDFFSRLTSRSLGYFLSRELPRHVGPGRRFADLGEHGAFNAALDLHCREASRIIKEFSGGWYGKTLFREGQISPEKARLFAHVAFKKIRAELRKRRDLVE